jgi:hypothetical protein
MRSTPLLALCCVVATASAARADRTTFHATASGSVATTDNRAGTPRNRQGALFSDVRPGFLLTHYASRHIHELLSEVSFLYTFFAERPSVTFRGGWRAFFLTGPRSEMSTDIQGSSGQMNALRAGDSPLETPTEVLPVGRVDVTRVSATQNGSWQAAKGSRLFERIFARYGHTDDENVLLGDVIMETREVGAGFGFDRRMRKHGLVFDLSGQYVYFDKQDPLIRQMGSRRDHQLNPRGVVVWQYDIDRNWSSNVDVGAVYVNPITELFGRQLRDPYNPDAPDRSSKLFPTFGGVLAYTDVWGRAMLNTRRAVAPNLLIAQNTVNDQVNLTFAMPLSFLEKDPVRRKPRVVGIGTAGYARTRLIDPITSETEGTFNVARLDFAVAWSPRAGQTYGMRYEITYQKGDTVGEMVVPSYFRNTFYFTFAMRYPEEVTVRVPRRQHQSVRADKGDLSPIGAEPVVIDPAELLEGQGGY